MYENAALHDENGAWQMIFGVNTIPECRKKGYAGQLIRCAIEQAKKEGRKGLVLTCKDKLLHYYETLALSTRVFRNRYTEMSFGIRCA